VNLTNPQNIHMQANNLPHNLLNVNHAQQNVSNFGNLNAYNQVNYNQVNINGHSYFN